MAKDINSNKPRGAQKKDDDSAVLKIMIALLLLVFSVFMLRLVANNYGTIVGADRIANASAVVAIVFGVLAAAALAAMLLVKSGWVKMAAPYVLAVSLLYALTGLLLRVYWTQYVLALTILHVAVYCLYVIYMLYRTEFFLCSLVTVAAGVLFYRYSHGIGANLACIALALLLVVLIGATAWIAANAAKGHGKLRLGKKKLAFFPSSFNPLALYITCAVWLVCFLACLLIGAAFAYYCTFAAVAFELIAAVYYTFQLK